jgi:hypothetical protein
LEHLTATTSNEKSEELMSENVLPKEQTSTPLMSDLEKSVKVLHLKRLKLLFPKKSQKRL